MQFGTCFIIDKSTKNEYYFHQSVLADIGLSGVTPTPSIDGVQPCSLLLCGQHPDTNDTSRFSTLEP